MSAVFDETRSARGAAATDFEELLAPLGVDEFFERHWEKTFLHLQRHEPRFYERVFTLADMDRWLASALQGAQENVVVMSSEGQARPLVTALPGDVSLRRLYQAVEAGETVLFNQIQETWAPLDGVVAGLREAFHGEVRVNLYLAPPGARTYPLHMDPHDVFILQLHGTKQWFLHEMRFLRVEHLEYRQELGAPYDPDELPRWPQIAQPELAAGDLLYVPRGMPHRVVATDRLSLHLTVSVHPPYWTDLLKAAVEQVAVRTPELQRTLPPGFSHRSDQWPAMADCFRAVLEAFSQAASFDEALRVLVANRALASRYPGDGHLEQLLRLEELTPESVVERRAGLVMALEPHDGKLRLRFADSHLQLPSGLRPALEAIRSRRRFRVGELPGLDDDSCRVLVRRLIREGLLRIVDPSGPAEASGDDG